jgi:hypothetical protein
MVCGQPGQKFRRPHLNQQLGVVVCTCHPSYYRKPKIRGLWSRSAWAKARPYLQDNKSKLGWRPGSSRELLPGKYKSLSSNPSTAKNKNSEMPAKNCLILK